VRGAKKRIVAACRRPNNPAPLVMELRLLSNRVLHLRGGVARVPTHPPPLADGPDGTDPLYRLDQLKGELADLRVRIEQMRPIDRTGLVHPERRRTERQYASGSRQSND
jgi:hypothetical protein